MFILFLLIGYYLLIIFFRVLTFQTIFLLKFSSSHQTELRLVQKIYHYKNDDHILFKLKGNGVFFYRSIQGNGNICSCVDVYMYTFV